MFIQIFTGVEQYTFVNANHIVSIVAHQYGSLLTLSTGETIKASDAPLQIVEQVSRLSQL